MNIKYVESNSKASPVCRLCNKRIPRSNPRIELSGSFSGGFFTVYVCDTDFNKFFGMVDKIKEQVLIRELAGIT